MSALTLYAEERNIKNTVARVHATVFFVFYLCIRPKKQKSPHGAFCFLVEVVRVELTSYAAAKRLSTYLVYLLFLNYTGRVNTLRVAQKAKYSFKTPSDSFKSVPS